MIAKVHNSNLLHGDFSPSNIILDENDKLYIIDAAFNYDKNLKLCPENDLGYFISNIRFLKPISKIYLLKNMTQYNQYIKIFLNSYLENIDLNVSISKIKKIELEYYKKYYKISYLEKNIISFIFWFFLSNLIYFLERKSNYKL
ncbi:tRNA A-37 threonylcarbamoyl transferase component Bud32 [Methanococcus maripaludis]|uniref:tRNA A-37 threonylcarbamoyl transferase component Bud32 n=2 Tax=Methanococcus maripaludis TaxID=39152 RepID=A0A7J9NT66_METMI|nr:tRNA A-37 threonylcarbamoyl transferase component Bud32 [Methanococcus maripaludis]